MGPQNLGSRRGQGPWGLPGPAPGSCFEDKSYLDIENKKNYNVTILLSVKICKHFYFTLMYYICAFSLSSQVETEGRKCLVNLNYLAVNMLTWILTTPKTCFNFLVYHIFTFRTQQKGLKVSEITLNR